MISESSIPPEASSLEETYQALRRSLQRRQGFGLLFVQCVPVEGQRLIQRLKANIPDKMIEVLALTEPIDDLFEKVKQLPNRDQINILLITGIEHSLVDYIKPGYGGQGDYYKQDSVPKVLGQLNLQREQFRDVFDICFVLLIPKFALKYFTRRAPDFFDWRSGVYEILINRSEKQCLSQAIISSDDYDEFKSYSHGERRNKQIEIWSFLEEGTEDQADLLLKQGNLFAASEEYESAIASYDKAIEIKPDYDDAWNNRGSALRELGQYESAIASFDKALELQPDKDETWYGRGNALFNLGQYEAAIASYDKAIEIKPDYDYAWYNRGNALFNLGQYETAISSYDKALELQPDDHDVWDNRGFALVNLGKHEAAIASFNKALEIKPDDPNPFYNKACAYALQSNIEQAIQNLQQALTLAPEEYANLAKTDSDFDSIRDDPKFQALMAPYL